jgi:hypothetical protein
MIASWRGLVIAAALTVVLAIAVAVDPGRTRGATDRALVPGFDPDQVTSLVWDHAGQPPIQVARVGGIWGTPTPSFGDPPTISHVPVDPGAVGDVLAALRGARWHRRGDPAPQHATLTVIAGTARHVLGIGPPLAGTEQTWLAVDGHGLLVDSWVARALDRDRLALRIKAPLADVRRAQAIVLERPRGAGQAAMRLQLDGSPRRLHAPDAPDPRDAPDARDAFVLAADAAAELERALGELTIVRMPDKPAGAHGLAITTTGGPAAAGAPATVHVAIGGGCPGAPDLIALAGSLGDGCIERAVADAVDRAVSRLQQAATALVERRPIPFEPARVVLADAAVLELSALRLDDGPAEPARVTELLAALAAPAEVAAVPASPATGHLVVTGRAGAAITLDLFADHVVARHGEPIALRPAPGAWRLLARPSRELRDVALWLEEPTTITAVQIDAVRYARGAAIGDWSRVSGATPGTAAGSASAQAMAADGAAALEALVAVLAAPRALGFVDGAVPAAHRVTLTVTPPTGAPVEHTITLGAPRPAGCPARVARDTVVLPAVVCAQVAALAR